MPTFPGSVAATRRIPASTGCAITPLYDLAGLAPPGNNSTPCSAASGPDRTSSQPTPIATASSIIRTGGIEPARRQH